MLVVRRRQLDPRPTLDRSRLAGAPGPEDHGAPTVVYLGTRGRFRNASQAKARC